MSKAALDGKTVLEIGTFLAAPFAANILGELGADIIKIEPFSGDPTRTMGKAGWPSGTFVAHSRGKRSICLDLREQEGRAILDRLLAKSDVLLHNLAPASARRLRITHDDCYAVNEKLIYCHIRGYGAGPRGDELASNPIAEASTGVMYTHKIEGRPTRLGPSYHDQFAANYAVIGILAAIASGRTDKASRHIEVGLYEAGLHVAARELTSRQLKTLNPAVEAEPEAGEFSFPGYGAYEASDGRWIYLVMLTDAHWRAFCTALKVADGDDPALVTSNQRKAQRKRVEKMVADAVRAISYDEAARRLSAVDFGFTEVTRPSEVLNAPQARHPGKVVQVPFRGGAVDVPSLPIDAPFKRDNYNLPPPALGAHTVEVLKSLGYTEAECMRLREKKIIRAL